MGMKEKEALVKSILFLLFIGVVCLMPITGCKDMVETTKVITVTDKEYLPLPVIATKELPVGARNVSYTAAIQVDGGESPYTFEITAGVLPDGLELDENTGIISGLPTLSGIYPFNLIVTDSKPDEPNTVTGGFLLRISASQYTFDRKWGTDFTTGKFRYPEHVAVDSAGSVYFADEHTNMVLKFDSAKNFVHCIGREGAGSAPFNYIRDVVMHNDILYVADSNEIRWFDASGNLSGIYNYPEHWRPVAICFDTAGNIFVIDSSKDEVVKFDSSWNELTRFGSFEYAVDIGSDGTDIFVVDREDECIYVFDNTGIPVNIWTANFDNPSGVAVDRISNKVFVTDGTLVKRLTTAGVFELEFGSTTGYWISEASICCSEGNVYVANYMTIKWYDSDGNPVDSIISDLSTDDCLDYPRGIAVSRLADILIDADYPAKDTLSKAEEKDYIVTGAGTFTIGALDISEEGVTFNINDQVVQLEETQFAFIKNTDEQQTAAIRIIDILLEAKGEATEDMVEFAIHLLNSTTIEDRVYVADTNNDCVKVYDLDGTFLFRFGQSGSGNGEFSSPRKVAVDNNFGFVYVADRYNDRVQRFDLHGNFLDAVYAGDGAFNSPCACDVDDWGNLIVADSSNQHVVVLDLEFNLLSTIQIDPVDVAVHKDKIYVIDDDEENVCMFKRNSNLLGRFSTSSWPESIAADIHGDIYVASNSTIMKHDSYGNQLARFGAYGIEDGEFRGTICLDIDKNGNLYVCDTYNCRVQKFIPDEVTGNAPELQVSTWLQAGPFEIKGNLLGKVVVLEFWSDYSSCADKVQDLNLIHNEYSTADVVVIGIATWGISETDALDVVNGTLPGWPTPMQYANALDKDYNDTSYIYNIKDIPTSIIIDQNGNLSWKSTTADYTTLKQKIDELLNP